MTSFLTSLLDVIRCWPVLEAIALIIWLRSLLAAWQNMGSTASDCLDERQLGAEVILAQLNGVITGSSIIVAGVGAFVAINKGVLPPASRHFELAAIFSIVGMGLAMYTLGTLPSRTPSENFVRSKPVAILCSTALFFALVGGIRFACGAISSIV
ncbi:hypothetical protein OOJ09_19150 [Mesorhizobium qingshengii]|uniref:Uncharacterized protein n=1 Tax=Mesorhizobium qingshengii TaxID=1165689 RepID=A0ABT4QXK2_9HYPH|nr:hypothetical protein [Mesorhizobium qingshengii]MCZ8546311.1 hypothetical protein [Mesorhizobium qingshengii]